VNARHLAEDQEEIDQATSRREHHHQGLPGRGDRGRLRIGIPEEKSRSVYPRALPRLHDQRASLEIAQSN
jgi:hypothetical protein